MNQQLESIADAYRAAYIAHDPRLAPITSNVRFTENCVEMDFPDASWDAVTREVGPALTLSDATTGQVGIFTSVMMNDTPGFLAVRLRVQDGLVTEIEHVLSTRRLLSGPPTPIGDVHAFVHDPALASEVPAARRDTRDEMVRLSDGYFSTLENNTGEIRGTCFAANTKRFENGMEFADVERLFRLGNYRFNARVRDREYFLVDEPRGLVMCRAFIDHKGVLDSFTLTDGTEKKSIFREPHSWSVFELFKIQSGMITSIEATFIAVPYNLRSPWTLRPWRLHPV
ncbi:MAG: hypothetical protein JSS88_00975 [Actinobacteria bacterium]|nr:hypothetical protein [Actinomycetota bacterium]